MLYTKMKVECRNCQTHGHTINYYHYLSCYVKCWKIIPQTFCTKATKTKPRMFKCSKYKALLKRLNITYLNYQNLNSVLTSPLIKSPPLFTKDSYVSVANSNNILLLNSAIKNPFSKFILKLSALLNLLISFLYYYTT
jgi:hypothetical protein